MARFGRSFRDAKAQARAADLWTHSMYGDGKPPQVAYAPEKPKRVKHEPDPNAPPLERDVLKAVWKLLAHHPRVAWVTRIQSGAAMMDFGKDGIHPMHFNRKRGIKPSMRASSGRPCCFGGQWSGCGRVIQSGRDGR